MIRKALAALVIMLVYPVFAMASITSDQSVGLADYPWMATGTYSSVFENAAWLGYYRNMVSFERIGAKEGDNVGALTLSPIKGLTLAVFAGIEIPDAT